jgi:hypothetical protein
VRSNQASWPDQARLRLAVEDAPPRRHLVEERTEREDVGPRVGLGALELLGRHVLERAQDRPRGGERPRLGRQRGRVRECGGPGSGAGEAEVEELRPGLREHHVAGLEVAVHDALLVRGGEGLRDLRPELHHLVERQRALLQAIREDLALEQLHHQEVRVGLVADVEERADVGVVEGGDRLGLALEALAALLVLGEGGGEDLDSDAAVEAGVLPPPDLAHSAGADGRRQLVGPEPRSGLDWHECAEYIARPCIRTSLDRLR